MEFGEKLQKLRKDKGLTQEELAEALYVSRTAVSKWESGRGYPNIESLKEISRFFSVSVDNLLSSEKLLSIAEKENKSNIRNMCNLIFGIADILSLVLIILPLYPNTVGDFVYSVNLLNYTQISQHNIILYWAMFVCLILVGIAKIILTKIKAEKSNKILTTISIVISIISVLFLALTREAYAVIVSFLLLIIKAIVFYNYLNNK